MYILHKFSGGYFMNKLNVGLIGAGRMGAFHGETLAYRLPQTKLYAVAAPAPGAAEKFINQLDINAKAYTDPMELIQDPEIDAVVIASPARTHASHVLAAIKQGKAVFCEKPMAVNLKEANEIVQASEKVIFWFKLVLIEGLKKALKLPMKKLYLVKLVCHNC